ncbi:MAG: topoisomerase IV [Ruminococcaceae bacterium]|nr:topoisomerase IV [Oscillospiraceae bacterium]
MARKKKSTEIIEEQLPEAIPVIQPITETIEKNYMPYAMSVIISRAIPEIDGFKPSHRKLLYTMYKMGLMTGNRTKSANIVGQTMKLNPHGDASIYETMVRLTKGNEALLHPFVDSKGSFGKHYSRDMAYAAARYTEAKLAPICSEIFRGIDKNAVEFIPNYDNSMTEPTLLPTAFPNVLVSPNMGVAVGMASSICSFNLNEICDGTIQLLKNPKTDIEKILDIIKAPDFPCGASIIYNRDQMREIYETGAGSIKLRARYTYDKEANCIDVIEIPYSTSIEAIMKRMTDLVKEGKLKEVTDFRDEIDLNGFKLTIDLRRGTDPDKLMVKLYKLTPLEDNFSCNFNVLVDMVPKQMGVTELLTEWIKFRMGCVKRELQYEYDRKSEKLHLLLGLGKIILDIDKAIQIIRDTKSEKDVIPNLMAGFDIDEIQANYIADIKLRNLNLEYIINRVKEIESLQKEIAELKDTIENDSKIKAVIAKQLKEIKEKFGQPRKTQLVYDYDVSEYNEDEYVENYNVKLILTRDGFFKKITLVSLRGNDEQKFKEGDEIRVEESATNMDEIVFFSDKCQMYKAKLRDFECHKASSLGDYVPAKLGFDEDEKVVYMKVLNEYKESDRFVFIFENGKAVKVPVTAYETKSNRKKLTGAYSSASPIVAVFHEEQPFDVLIISDNNRAIMINTKLITEKTTRSSQGASVFKLTAKQKVAKAVRDFDEKYPNGKNCRKIKVPATGSALD